MCSNPLWAFRPQVTLSHMVLIHLGDERGAHALTQTNFLSCRWGIIHLKHKGKLNKATDLVSAAAFFHECQTKQVDPHSHVMDGS